MKLADGSMVDRYSDGFGTLAASRIEHVPAFPEGR
jgi:hypothetical protein